MLHSISRFYRYLHNNPPGFKWTMYIIFLSLLVLVNTTFEYLIPRQFDEVIMLIHAVDYFICASFFIDFVWRLTASSNKWRFMRTGWIDLLASIPYFTFFRLGKLFFVFSVIRTLRSADRVLQFLFINKLSITLIFTSLVFASSILISAVMVLYFERGEPGANINTPGDAIWWAINLASTCGNTNCEPITVPGRIVGGCLVIIGYGLFSINAGILSSWFYRNLQAVKAITQADKNKIDKAGATQSSPAAAPSVDDPSGDQMSK